MGRRVANPRLGLLDLFRSDLEMAMANQIPTSLFVPVLSRTLHADCKIAMYNHSVFLLFAARGFYCAQQTSI
jgi:hypothetical protein